MQSLDGIVVRDSQGIEERYPVILTSEEKLIARKVCLAFKVQYDLEHLKYEYNIMMLSVLCMYIYMARVCVCACISVCVCVCVCVCVRACVHV